MQTSYSQYMEKGFAGMIQDSAIVQDIKTFKNPQSVSRIGQLVTRGTNEERVVHPSTAAGVTDEKLVRGVIVHEHDLDQETSTATPSYSQYQAVPVMRKGRIWVIAEDIITEGTSTVNVRYAGTGDLGAFRGAAVASETAVLPKAKWCSSTTAAGQLAVLEIDL